LPTTKQKEVNRMENNQIERELFFADMIIGLIDNVERPILLYEGEKEVVKKALNEYIDKLKSEQRGR
jgi:hypothetical protein